MSSKPDLDQYKEEYRSIRGVSLDAHKFFKVPCLVDANGVPHYCKYTYSNGAEKYRNLKKKNFFWKDGKLSSTAGVFGKDKFIPGAAKAVTIVEGEHDALAVWDMLGNFPVVSVQSSSQAKRDVQHDYDWLNKFEKIYICFDGDSAGRAAAKQVAQVFPRDKVYVVSLPDGFDPNRMLVEGKSKEFRQLWYGARRYTPDNILASRHDFQKALDSAKDKPSIPWPWRGMQDATYGIRTGEIVLFTALEGIGKTEVVRALEHWVLKTTDAKIGCIHLEEPVDRMLKGLAGLELGFPCHLPTTEVDNETILDALEGLAGEGIERLYVYRHFGADTAEQIVDAIRYLVAGCGCKYIFFDHISDAIAATDTKDERREIDVLMQKLGSLVEELDFSMILVSHENDDGKTRGSRYISKKAHLHVRLIRDKEAKTREERNTTTLLVVKNRFGAETGPVQKLYFDRDTFSLRPLDEDDDPVEEELPT